MELELVLEKICGACGCCSEKVEAGGIWHCPNPLCKGVGSAWFIRTLNSYRNDDDCESCDMKERLEKGLKYLEQNPLKFVQVKNRIHIKDLMDRLTSIDSELCTINNLLKNGFRH